MIKPVAIETINKLLEKVFWDLGFRFHAIDNQQLVSKVFGTFFLDTIKNKLISRDKKGTNSCRWGNKSIISPKTNPE